MSDTKSTSVVQKDPMQQIKLLLMVVLGAAIVVPFLSTTLAINSLSSKLQSGDKSSQVKGEESEKAEETTIVFYEPMEFLVNLADTEANHYLKAIVSLGSREIVKEEPGKKKSGGHGGGHGKKTEAEVPQPEVFKKIKAEEPVIRDIIISVASAYPMSALISAQGKRELKETIQERLKLELGTESLEVYFTSFTLQ